MKIPVKLEGEDVNFLLDTGIGLTVILKSFADEMGLEPIGEFSGRRMSGQQLKIPLAQFPEIEVGGLVRKDLEVGIYELGGLPPAFSKIKGILAVNYFQNKVLTFDYTHSLILVSEELVKWEGTGEGAVVPVNIEYNGPTITIFIDATLPNGDIVKLEVDTGSDVLILNSKFMSRLGVSPEDPNVKVFTGTDETSYSYKRYSSEIKGKLEIGYASSIFQESPRVVFQDIIYDGLLGNDFLKRFTVVYDLDHLKMIFYKG